MRSHNRFSKEKHTNKSLKAKSCFRENYNLFCKKQISPTNPSHYEKTCKWCCKDCSLILTSEERAREHFLGRRHQNIVNNKFFSNVNCSRRINPVYNMSQEKQNSFLRKNHNDAIVNLPLAKNLEVQSILCNLIPVEAGRDNILSTVIKSVKGNTVSTDLSIYRTPSGKYYCQSCDLTVNSQAQFLQHTESRKHKYKANKPYKL